MKVPNFSCSILIILSLCFSYANLTAQHKVGILVLAHGGNKNWNHTVNEAVEHLKKNYEVEIAFGMADPKSMQKGINKLEEKGITKIVVLQLFISSFSPIIRQNEYLLGLRKELADEPMIMNHTSMNHSHIDSQQNNYNNSLKNHTHHISNDNMNHNGEELKLKPLSIKAKIYLTDPLNDHPVVAEILTDRIRELSNSPENETIILVAHGPNDEEDNKKWLSTLESIAEQIRKESNNFKNIFCLTVRDDAPKEIYEIAKENLRSLVRQASKNSSVIIIPVLLSQGGIEKGIVERLDGLTYKWNGKTLLPNKKIIRFLDDSIKKALQE
ncbi:sirohydrochlorin chelatase [Melioribacteraceae bacterium 4301-Me]|uniref:sirohydrochlorin chelatase n=1 Tax=Pyranulibacter aquaticus TaxID=3163344 RepID=UPI003594A554